MINLLLLGLAIWILLGLIGLFIGWIFFETPKPNNALIIIAMGPIALLGIIMDINDGYHKSY